MAVDWNKPIQTKTGGQARYLGKLERALFPHVVAYSTVSNGEQLVCVDSDGRSTLDGSAVSPWYAVEVTNVPQKHVRWVNGYGNGYLDWAHHSREGADAAAERCSGSCRIACIRIEYEEGEGL